MCKTKIILTIALLLCISQNIANGNSTPVFVGNGLLTDAGIEKPEDIESVITEFAGNTYKVTWETDRELIADLYKGLQEMRIHPNPRTASVDSSLVLNLRRGRTLYCSIRTADIGQPGSKVNGIYLTRKYVSTSLTVFFKKLVGNENAAKRDSRVVPLAVKQVQIRDSRAISKSLDLSSSQGKAVIDKAASLIDCLDLRTARASVVGSNQFDSLTKGKGMVCLTLEEPLIVNIMVYNRILAPQGGFPDPFSKSSNYEKVVVDQVYVAGSEYMPQIAFRERYMDRYYVSGSYLTRRRDERYGVEKMHMSGHPVSDTSYYKEPVEFYKDLMKLTDQIVRESREEK